MPSLGLLSALASAVIWGSGDFSGGMAARRADPFQVLVLSACSGVTVLGVLALFAGEAVPSVPQAAWAAAAGLAAAVGIASLYRGLAVGSAATVAPTAAVITAAVPVLFSALTAGFPHLVQASGFLLAGVGIWLVASGPRGDGTSTAGLKLALIAGVGFGGFLVLIAQVPSSSVFMPLAVARLFTCGAAFVLLLVRRTPLPSLTGNPFALLAGLLDAGGNIFYMIARQHIRLDVAGVLSSLYPAATVMLARFVLDEPVTPTQWVGAGVCLAAVGLIAI